MIGWGRAALRLAAGRMPTKSGAETPKDMDTQMLFGCSGFVAASFSVYLLAVWPHAVWSQTHALAVLARCLIVGNGPALLAGLVWTRKFGLAGGAGVIGGSVASSVFLYLRLQQVMAFKGIPEAPQPEYPDSWAWLLPLAWVVLQVLAVVLVLPKGELFPDRKSP
jgi:hypothetical protein